MSSAEVWSSVMPASTDPGPDRRPNWELEIERVDRARERRDVASLIDILDSQSDVAEEAQFALISLGSPVIEPLMRVTPGFKPFAQLCAIEVYRELKAVEATPVVIQLLGNDIDTVREWAADLLADFNATSAIPSLEAAYERAKNQQTPPDWTEPVSLRRALTVLGARRNDLPATLALIRAPLEKIEDAWPTEQLLTVIEELAANHLAVLFFQTWELREGKVYWVDHQHADGEIQWWSTPWAELVALTRKRALEEASRIVTRPELFATVSWISRDDLQ